MIRECARVARRGLCITTPNRWFPVEFHTQLPLVHWLPKPWFRTILQAIGQSHLAREENFKLMSATAPGRAAGGLQGWSFHISTVKLFGMRSNLILFGTRH